MLLSILAFAAALQAGPLVEIPAAPLVKLSPPSSKAAKWDRAERQAKKTPTIGQGAAWCGGSGFERVAKVQSARPQRLGDLPMANHTLTVLRMQNGCPVSSTVRFNVGR